ncbi:Tigger transposable element-derived protein 6 [Dictyocoela muelleri]|nr:Tigger transposable element-derived protein 6 [Dictyocoela muelleri]
MNKLSEEEWKKFKEDVTGIVKYTKRELSEKYNLSKGSVFRLKKIIQSNAGKEHNTKIPFNKNKIQPKLSLAEMDNQILKVFSYLRNRSIPINGPCLKDISTKIAIKNNKEFFKASNGWLDKFRRRNDLSFKNISGESQSAETSLITDFKSRFEKIKLNYEISNIFNCDETALYYKNVPKKSYVTSNDRCKGTKQNKVRITVLLTCRMVGEKYNPLVIGHFKQPTALRNFNTEEIGVIYTHSTKAWMTGKLFTGYLDRLNEYMLKKSRKILLLLDNTPSHPVLNFSNIEIFYFPKNTTSVL